MNIFPQITAGDSASWTESRFSDTVGNLYSPPSWALAYELRAAAIAVTLVGAATGSGWAFSISATQSQLLNPQPSAITKRVWWSAYATNGAQRVTAGTGYSDLLPNLSGTFAAFDGRTQAEINLAAVEGAINSRISGDLVTKYTIGARSLEKEPMAALRALRSELRMDIASDRAKQSIANGLGDPRRVGVSFRGVR